MKTAALFSVFLSTFYVAFAQKETTFVLSLEGYETTEKATIPFGFIKVIDARFEQKNIGCVVKNFSYKAITEEKMAAFFPEGLTPLFAKSVTPDYCL